MRKDSDRIRQHTAPKILRKIDENTEARVRFYATQPKGLISARIEELEGEWDIERYLQINASALAFSGLALGSAMNKKWLLLTAGMLGILFQHATHGWCLPTPVMRRMGIRTRSEIEREKYALKTLRGDFQSVQPRTDYNQLACAQDALRASAV